jgi:hypothetical protein
MANDTGGLPNGQDGSVCAPAGRTRMGPAEFGFVLGRDTNALAHQRHADDTSGQVTRGDVGRGGGYGPNLGPRGPHAIFDKRADNTARAGIPQGLSRLASSGCPLKIPPTISRHSTVSMLERYLSSGLYHGALHGEVVRISLKKVPQRHLPRNYTRHRKRHGHQEKQTRTRTRTPKKIFLEKMFIMQRVGGLANVLAFPSFKKGKRGGKRNKREDKQQHRHKHGQQTNLASTLAPLKGRKTAL